MIRIFVASALAFGCLALDGGHGTGRMADFLWTAPLIIGSAFLIAWGAEAAQFMMSQGLALAILAWLQTLPEFAVEANNAWHAAKGTAGYTDGMVTANFTGSIRLLMGFGMPVVWMIYAATKKKGTIELDPLHSVEVVSIVPPVIYFFFMVWRGRLDLLDTVILLGLYGMYLVLLLRMPPEEEDESVEELPFVARAVLKRGKRGRVIGVVGIFLLGGLILYLCVHPFVGSLMALGAAMAIPQYFLIQWIAPFLSEFPEKVSAFNWARQEGKAKLGLMNFLSSNINQMTMLVAMIPVLYCIAKGSATAGIDFSEEQKHEVFLTAAQSLLCAVLLFNMKFEWWDAVGMFTIWIAQFTGPFWERAVGMPEHGMRTAGTYLFLGWAALEILLAAVGVRKWQFPLRLRARPRSP